MLLTITNNQVPATDLGYLLHKNPKNMHSIELPFGRAHVFYPQTSQDRCTVAVLLEIDPVGLVRGRAGSDAEGLLEQYVNDRPYVASSFLSVAIAKLFGTALSGKSKERQDLADTAIPLEVCISCLPCREGEQFLRRLFEPLGYKVAAEQHPLDEKFPEWGEGPYFRVHLKHTIRLQELLRHLYVLIPVLDDKKHYWVSDDEIEKLLRHGEGWLASHPDVDQITKRYLKHQYVLTREAIERLMADESPHVDQAEENHAQGEADLERKINLNEDRMLKVLSVLKEHDVKRVIDLGCGEGKFLRHLLAETRITEIVGMDVSYRSLSIASKKLELDRMQERQRSRIKLIQGSLIYRDERIHGFEAAALIEVIEHLDLSRLSSLERVIFEFARPKLLVVTTPNSEYNVKFPNLPAGKFRHKDHRFEWTRAEFESWAKQVASKYGYSVQFSPIGTIDPDLGAPTQMGVFTS
jgi:3' terminal RNA ribose 2'-O-methyltransferase Hen1